MADLAESHDFIEVRGARENNLANIALDVPKRKLTVFTGVSGSGKSSLVFGTIAAESRRLINETYTAFVQSFMVTPGRPDVDSLRNLSAAIVVDQERIGVNARSTVGTATDAHTMLRLIFSRIGSPRVTNASAFSFNSHEGMCPACEGIGRVSDIDVRRLVDAELSLNEGAVKVPNFHVGSPYWSAFANSGLLDPDAKLKDYTSAQWHDFLYLPATKLTRGSNAFYEGLVVKVKRLYLSRDRDAVKPHIRAFVDGAVAFAECGSCKGTRLNPAALAVKVAGRTLAECCAMQISDLAEFVRALADPEVGPVRAELANTLDSLADVGLGYLSLDRESGSLSGGETQRVKMVRHLGSPLSDITYVFDEPTIGLHPHDVARMNGLLLRLRDKGNTVLVVEHEPETILIADHVVDLGPGAGENGGQLCYSGDVAGLRASGTLTGRHLDHHVALREHPRAPTGFHAIDGADLHNLRGVSVKIPQGVLTVVTGVAGSGKSSLIHGYLSGLPGIVTVDQSPIRGSRRSSPATYTGLLDSIRAEFAKVNGVKAALFSANSAGACQHCAGIGLIYTDLAMLGQVATVCEACEGRRFTPEVLRFKLHGLDISQVLALSVSQARELFRPGQTGAVLERLEQVGLGYLGLGQPMTSLSGGERQRLKLAVHMASPAVTYVLDEPTSGLHMADVDRLNGLLAHLVDSGNTVIVIEHNLAVAARADWIIDLGPGAGHDGGQVIFEGTASELVRAGDTLTARYLRAYLDLP